MLQPNQPMGQPNMAATGPQAPKPAMPGMPQQGKPQGTPAGALMGMMPQGGIMAPIDKVAGAYQGNPQALEQKAVSGDLLAALALQRLKTEKEAAMRQMQMTAAGQQQGPQPTVVDQLEQQALDLTKQEMQAEQMDTLKQKQSQQQQGQQRLMQAAMNPQAGLPGLPAPNAAEPKAMAAGGIVAFDEGGNEGLEFDPNAYTPSGAGIADLGKVLPTLTKLTPEQEAEMNRILRQYKGRVSAMQAREIAQGKRSESEIKPTEIVPPPGAAPAAAPAAPGSAPANAANIAPPKGIQNAGIVPGGAQPPAPRPAPAAPQAGLPSLQGAVNQSLTTPEQRSAAAATEREGALKFIGYSPEDEAKRRENLAGLEAIDKARFDPDRMANERLARTLGAAGGQSFLGSLGRSMTQESARAGDEQYRQQREATAARNKAFEDLIGKSQEIKKEAYGAGQNKEKLMSEEFRTGLHEGTSMRNADVAASVSALNAAAQRDTAAAMREGQNFARLQGALVSVTDKREKARQVIMEKFSMNPDFILLNKDPSKLSSDEKSRIKNISTQINNELATGLKDFDLQLESLQSKLGYSGINAPAPQSPAGWSAKEKTK